MADSLTPAQSASIQAQAAPGPSADGAPQSPATTIEIPQVLARYRRLLLFTAGSLMLAGFIGLVLWSSETPYRAVYAGMSEKDAAAIVEVLQKEHIPYRLEGSGTVMVPADQVYQVRLKLAGQGVAPSGNTGFELFDQSNEFGLSDFTRKVNLQRALQGELARTIEVIPQVQAARVHLVMPKESAFAERNRKASASVMLQIGGQRLPKKTVLAIQNLVAASIPELEPGAVTVVDSSGNMLSGNDEKQPMSEGQSMQEYQARLERNIEQRITGMLEQIVGPGQAVVRVSSSINREYVEQNSTRYNPDEQVLRSQKAIEEKHSSTGTNAAPIGVPGMASNTPGANPAVQADGSVASAQPPQDQASRSESVNNYEISTTHEHRIVPFGSIRKLSVAVIVGGHYTTDKDGKQVFTPRSKEELASIRQLVERAMGYDENREDSLEVQSLPLVDISSNADREALEAAENKAFYLQIARYSMAALALVLLALFVLRPLARRLGSNEVEAQGNPLPSLPEPTQLSPEAYQRLANLEKLRQSVAMEPDRASRVLREWVDPA